MGVELMGEAVGAALQDTACGSCTLPLCHQATYHSTDSRILSSTCSWLISGTWASGSNGQVSDHWWSDMIRSSRDSRESTDSILSSSRVLHGITIVCNAAVWQGMCLACLDGAHKDLQYLKGPYMRLLGYAFCQEHRKTLGPWKRWGRHEVL